MDKAEVARRQLGTALDLFLHDRDSVSVHCLALGGGEIAEWLAERVGAEPFKRHALGTFPDLKPGELNMLRRKFWNAFKHATNHSGKARDDETVLADFSSDQNDHALFVGWYDYGEAALPLPIEAQAFQAWYFAKYPDKIDPNADSTVIERFFPALHQQSRSRQLTKLNEVIRKVRKMGVLMSDPRTDRRPLIMT